MIVPAIPGVSDAREHLQGPASACAPDSFTLARAPRRPHALHVSINISFSAFCTRSSRSLLLFNSSTFVWPFNSELLASVYTTHNTTLLLVL